MPSSTSKPKRKVVNAFDDDPIARGFLLPGPNIELVHALHGTGRFDAGRGLAQYLDGVQRMGYDARKWDRHFAQTLSFGPGPVRAATLTLRLKSISGMSRNDSLYLEYLGERRFLWGIGIKTLPEPGEWSRGERATVHLDLSRLPAATGSDSPLIDLLPALEDGLLDVVIQDDTAVLDIELRVLR